MAGMRAARSRRTGRGRVLAVFEDMALIREFETSLNQSTTQGTYRGGTVEHKGRLLSLGQGADPVGTVYAR